MNTLRNVLPRLPMVQSALLMFILCFFVFRSQRYVDVDDSWFLCPQCVTLLVEPHEHKSLLAVYTHLSQKADKYQSQKRQTTALRQQAWKYYLLSDKAELIDFLL